MADGKEEEKGDGVYTIIAADDGSLPVKSDEDKQAMLKQRKMFEMDSYYKYIMHHTYKTEFIPVSFAEANALRLYFRDTLYQDKNADSIQHFSNLQANLNTAINKLKSTNPSGQFFVRMSTRSPKDACDKPLFRTKLIELMRERFVNEDGFNAEYHDLNKRLIGLRECFSKVLCVSNCDQMLELLSFSERCVSDLKRLMDHKHLLDKWDLYLVVREFKFIPIQNEFRCFVHNSQLTAITQYFPHCYFPQSIQQNADTIKRMITEYYKNRVLKECGELNVELNSSYVLDLNVDVAHNKIMIIELNPFAQTTGAGFFDWMKDKDVLYGMVENEDDNKYPEIRVRTEIDKHLDAVLSQWSPVFTQFEKEMNHSQTSEDDICVCTFL
eukprot:101998_1